jgi:hypothetical protein
MDAWSWGSFTPSTTTAWATQYRAIYVPVRVPQRVTVVELGVSNGTTATGNIDIGLYDSAGTRLVSTGSTAKSASAVIQAIDVTDTTIGPGLYYLGLNNDTTTDTVGCEIASAPLPAAMGVLAETLGAVTLPATASWGVSQTLGFVPFIVALLVTEVS